MTDPLPCPFCGSEAKRHDIEAREDVDNAGASYIECEGCGACTQLHFDRKENLLDIWNRRVRVARLTDALNEIAARDRQNFPPHGGSIAALAARACRDYDPTTQPFDEPFRHVDRPNDEFRRGFLEGIRIAAEEANGVHPDILKGMSERYVSIYCAARRDASDLIKVIPYMHCEYCDAGKRTGLASNACENCMNTGLKYPEFAK